MDSYDNYSKEQLIVRIKELEKQLSSQSDPCCLGNKDFKEEHGVEILNILPDMLSVFDHDYQYVALASSEKTVHVGGSSDQLIGKNLIDILPPDAYKPVKENFDKVLASGQPSVGFHDLFVNGEKEHFENRVIPLDDRHILCICRNISERVRAQSQLEMVTSAINNSIEEIYAVRPDGTLIFANKQYLRNHHIEDDISNHKIYDFCQYKGEEQWEALLQQLKEKGNQINYNCEYTNEQGQKHIHYVLSYISKDNAGNEIIWSISRDASEKIEQENKIEELNQLLTTILNNIPVYLFVKDSGDNMKYIYWNKMLAEQSYIPTSNVIGKTDEEVFPDVNDAQKFKADDLELLTKGERIDMEESYLAANGERRYVHTIKTMAHPEGRKPLLIGIAVDITAQKQTEKELIEARMRAEEADKLKSAFLANMSHEIRTPLNAIVGFSQLMAETDNDKERKQYFDIVNKNTDLLLQLINDILDLSKIEAGMMQFTQRPVNLNILCQGIYETTLPRTPENVKLIYEGYPESVTVVSDSNRLAQVLCNLIGNAQKFTFSGEIRFGFRPEGKQIKFTVKDTGMGISKENLGKIFNRFIKLNNFIQGTGLGLPICQMIIKNLGGIITAESEENVGTTFTFTIPNKSVATPPKTILENEFVISRNKDAQRTILIAEDVDSNYLLLKTLLGKKYHLLHACNGKEAVEMFQTHAPDLILMDIKMPEMDGLEATRKIREISNVPIIALTAFAFESDKENAQEAGCNNFLTKPIHTSQLNQMLEKYL